MKSRQYFKKSGGVHVGGEVLKKPESPACFKSDGIIANNIITDTVGNMVVHPPEMLFPVAVIISTVDRLDQPDHLEGPVFLRGCLQPPVQVKSHLQDVVDEFRYVGENVPVDPLKHVIRRQSRFGGHKVRIVDMTGSQQPG